MPELIARGATITLEAFSTDNFGVATDASALTVSIEDASGATVLANQTPTHIATGSYTYAYTVPSTGTLGAWEAEWSGTVGGIPLLVSDGFTVVEPFQVITPGGLTPTVDELICEVEDHLLGGDRDELNEVASAIGLTDTTLTLTMPLSGVTDGSYLGIELEVLLVKSVDSTSQVVTVRRGMLGSTAATHAQNTLVYVNPLFSKWQIFKSLNIEITSLSGADNGLFAETAFTVTTASVQKTYDVPVANDDIRKLLEVRYDAIGPEKYWPVVPLRNCQIIRDVTTDSANTSGLAIRIEQSFTPGRSLVVRYAGDFVPLPASLSSDAAASTKLGTTMIDIPAIGAAARLMGVREAKRTFVERSVDTRRAAEVPAGSSARAAGVLLQLLDGRIKSEAARLRQKWPDAW